jgi:hypothetical protein
MGENNVRLRTGCESSFYLAFLPLLLFVFCCLTNVTFQDIGRRILFCRINSRAQITIYTRQNCEVCNLDLGRSLRIFLILILPLRPTAVPSQPGYVYGHHFRVR